MTGLNAKNNNINLLGSFLRFFRIKSLSVFQLTLFLLIFTSLVSIGLISGLWAYTETAHVRQNIKELKELTLAKQKEKLRDEVHQVLYYLEFCKNDTITPINELKETALNYFQNIRFGNNGYIFINTYAGDALLFDDQKVEGHKSIVDLTDPEGLKIFEKEMELAENPDGGYFQYLFKRIN